MKIRVSFFDADDEYQTELALTELPALQQLRWVRREWAHRNQKHTPSMFYFSTLKQSVYCESHLEAQTLLHLDFRGDINTLIEQPFVLHHNKKFHIPDYVYQQGNTITLINVKPSVFLEKEDNIIDFELANEAARQLGWKYQTISELNPQYLDNISWLATFKETPLRSENYTNDVLDFLKAPSNLAKVLGMFENPFFVKPVVFHLLWHRKIHTDLHQRFSLEMPLWNALETL